MRRNSLLLAGGALSLVFGLLFVGAIARGDDAKNVAKTSGAAAGLITDFKADSITIQIDGDDAPTTFTYGPGITQPGLAKGHVYPVNRVNFKWKLNGDNKEIDAIQKVPGKASGTVIGTVIKVYDNFWVSVKPTNGGIIEGFALNGAAKDGTPGFDVLKSLNPGDIVGIRYTTDFERHRIQQIQVKPAAGK